MTRQTFWTPHVGNALYHAKIMIKTGDFFLTLAKTGSAGECVLPRNCNGCIDFEEWLDCGFAPCSLVSILGASWCSTAGQLEWQVQGVPAVIKQQNHNNCNYKCMCYKYNTN